MNDKARTERNRSAFGQIAANLLGGRLGEPDRLAVIQAPDEEASADRTTKLGLSLELA